MKLLFAILVAVIIPFIGGLYGRKMTKISSDRLKSQAYLAVIAVNAILIVCLCALTPVNHFFHIKASMDHVKMVNIVVFCAACFLALTQWFPTMLLPFSKPLQIKVHAVFDYTRYPASRRQRRMFLVAAIFVGVGEEMAYWAYLHGFLAERLAAPPSVVFLTVAGLFGLAHFHQGVSGIVHSFLFGLLMGYLYLSTGSLLYPVLLHILSDMRIPFISHVLKGRGDSIRPLSGEAQQKNHPA